MFPIRKLGMSMMLATLWLCASASQIHIFGSGDSTGANAALIQATDGDFYGTTKYGANTACSEGCGTIFSLAAGLN